MNELGGYENFSKDPIKYLDDNNLVGVPLLNIQASANVMKKILSEKNIFIYEDEKFDLYELIEIRQHRSMLFLLGLDWYTLHNEERIYNDHGGHLVVCSGVKDGKFIIHDPGPNIINSMSINKDRLYNSMEYGNSSINCIIVKYV